MRVEQHGARLSARDATQHGLDMCIPTEFATRFGDTHEPAAARGSATGEVLGEREHGGCKLLARRVDLGLALRAFVRGVVFGAVSGKGGNLASYALSYGRVIFVLGGGGYVCVTWAGLFFFSYS